ncbi:unnamed protein product [Mycena citricolor]|uniref:Major facilitator superfamily (MFS) profile domain-containing protein n=1 Tax=Mycena citricolor TaxID=2018698 RepID=A0AAD2K3D0_9AGAR|nr:unnamed protein product [Mycena citricolor]CAK5276654.1 unnamed protein product [Mycena citricolor]
MTISPCSSTSSLPMAKTARTPIPKLQLFILVSIQFAEPITALVIYPFVVSLVRDTGITRGDDNRTGYYAGLLESVFFLGEGLTAFHFGRLADAYGRRPVLLLAPLGLALATLGCGLTKSFWVLFFFRCAQGIFNGNIGVSKTVMNEARLHCPMILYAALTVTPDFGPHKRRRYVLHDSSHVERWRNFCNRPFIGGVLEHPATKWPNTMGKIEFLRNNPYFLPCAAASAIALFSFIVGFIGLRETLPSLVKNKKKRCAEAPRETDPLLPASDDSENERFLTVRELLTGPVLVALSNHGMLQFCDMAYEALLPLVYATPIEHGGFGLSPYDIGRMMAVIGIISAVLQTFAGGRIIRYFGPRKVFISAFCAHITGLAAYPIIGILIRRAGHITPVAGVVLALQLGCGLVKYFAYASTLIFLMDSSPNKANVGAVNGLGQMIGTLLRSLAPTFSSSLFAVSVKYNLAGGYLGYLIIATIALCSVANALRLPKRLKSGERA